MDEYKGQWQVESLAEAAKINSIFRMTGDPTVGLELHTALYELLEAMVGKTLDQWRHEDLDNVELSAKAICQVFGVGMSMERNEPLWWDLNPK